jgi:cytochrome P450
MLSSFYRWCRHCKYLAIESMSSSDQIDTQTPSAMGTFFLAMASNPRIQQVGQAEIERVTGGHRFPGLSDRPNMPYVNAIVQEVFRCSIIGPLSSPHVSAVDNIYNGYFIPKGSIIMSNIWYTSNII